MVEGGSIDWANHRNAIDKSVGEVLEFDKTIEQTIEYLSKEGLIDNTLIIVTGDHETNGLTITGPYKSRLAKGEIPEVKYCANNHTAIPVMVWATGPGAEKITGKHENTFVFDLMKSTLD